MIAKVSNQKTKDNDVAYETILNFTNKYENSNGEAVLQIKQTYNQDDVEALKEKEQEENSFYAYMYDDAYYEEQYKEKNLTYKMHTTFAEEEIKFNVTFDGNEQEGVSSRGVSSTIKFGSNINIPKLEDSNTIIINNYSSEDFENLAQEFVSNLTKNVQENPDMLLGTELQIYICK